MECTIDWMPANGMASIAHQYTSCTRFHSRPAQATNSQGQSRIRPSRS